MNNPLVSIIIPTYNRAHVIGETLDSIIAQTYKNWECIVVDDGSTDDTYRILEEYSTKDSRIQYHHRPKIHKRGANGARNYGYKLSRGKYVNWFDSDDLMHEELLEILIEKFLNNNNNIDCVFSSFTYFDKDLNNLDIKKYNFSSKTFFYDYIKGKVIINSNFCLWRRTFFKDQLLYNENLLKYQDIDFNARALLREPKTIYYCEKPLGYIRRDGKRISKDKSFNRLKSVVEYYSSLYILVLENFPRKHHILKVLKIKYLCAFYELMLIELDLFKRVKFFQTERQKSHPFFDFSSISTMLFVSIFQKGFVLIRTFN